MPPRREGCAGAHLCTRRRLRVSPSTGVACAVRRGGVRRSVPGCHPATLLALGVRRQPLQRDVDVGLLLAADAVAAHLTPAQALQRRGGAHGQPKVARGGGGWVVSGHRGPPGWFLDAGGGPLQQPMTPTPAGQGPRCSAGWEPRPATGLLACGAPLGVAHCACPPATACDR